MWDQVEREVGARLSRVFYDWQRADQGICSIFSCENFRALFGLVWTQELIQLKK